MGKMKNEILSIIEMFEDGVKPREIALFMGMSVEQVVQILEAMGRYEDPMESDYEQN